MTDLNKAVFLSYASEDATAAQRICTALRSAGVEVWFDQSELRGGDAWDAAIRQQIRTCALFIAVISRNTRAREEGYFRLEWKIAIDRSHLMSTHKTFLVPVVIDDTPDSNANVPDRFGEVQWTRLPQGEPTPAFVNRVARLLSPDPVHVPASIPAEAPAAVSRQPGSRRKFTPLWGVAAVLLLGVLGYGVWRLSPHQASAASSPAAAGSGLPGGKIPEKSIAVMPFENLSPDKDQDYFSDGLSEELIDQLSKNSDLRVPARSSSFYFKGKNEDVATIAQKLRVAHVLEGSVRKSGNRLRVTAELIRADNGYHLWSETYDRELQDVFKVQDEIASAVVAALKLKLVPEQHAAPQRTSSTEAYNAYLLGRQFLGRNTPDGNQRAVLALQRAVSLDPAFASAYAQLAIAESYVADLAGDREGEVRAAQWAEKAVELNPEGADTLSARGYLRFGFEWDFVGAQADLSKALVLDPGDSVVLRRYSQLLASLGKLSEAIVQGRKAVDADPLNSSSWQNLGQLLMGAGDLPAAEAANARALEIAPDSTYALSDLGTIRLLQGRARDALTVYQKITVPAFHLMGMAMASYSTGQAQQSQQAMDKLTSEWGNDAAYQIAQAYAWRGEKDQAFTWLERGIRQHDGGMANLQSDAVFATIHSDPRYTAILRKLNMIS